MNNVLAGMIDFDLQSKSDETLTRRLYQQLRAAILAGALPPGYRLPSSRDLAQHLKISRNTVSFVVDQLAMEGYLEAAGDDVQRSLRFRSPNWSSVKETPPRRLLPSARRTGRSDSARPTGLSHTKASRGRFCRDWPMGAPFRTTYGPVAFDVRPATRWYHAEPG
jgi:DNA-binding transcriptional MocR family regulator